MRGSTRSMKSTAATVVKWLVIIAVVLMCLIAAGLVKVHKYKLHTRVTALRMLKESCIAYIRDYGQAPPSMDAINRADLDRRIKSAVFDDQKEAARVWEYLATARLTLDLPEECIVSDGTLVGKHSGRPCRLFEMPGVPEDKSFIETNIAIWKAIETLRGIKGVRMNYSDADNSS